MFPVDIRQGRGRGLCSIFLPSDFVQNSKSPDCVRVFSGFLHNRYTKQNLLSASGVALILDDKSCHAFGLAELLRSRRKINRTLRLVVESYAAVFIPVIAK